MLLFLGLFTFAIAFVTSDEVGSNSVMERFAPQATPDNIEQQVEESATNLLENETR